MRSTTFTKTIGQKNGLSSAMQRRLTLNNDGVQFQAPASSITYRESAATNSSRTRSIGPKYERLEQVRPITSRNNPQCSVQAPTDFLESQPGDEKNHYQFNGHSGGQMLVPNQQLTIDQRVSIDQRISSCVGVEKTIGNKTRQPLARCESTMSNEEHRKRGFITFMK